MVHFFENFTLSRNHPHIEVKSGFVILNVDIIFFTYNKWVVMGYGNCINV